MLQGSFWTAVRTVSCIGRQTLNADFQEVLLLGSATPPTISAVPGRGSECFWAVVMPACVISGYLFLFYWMGDFNNGRPVPGPSCGCFFGTSCTQRRETESVCFPDPAWVIASQDLHPTDGFNICIQQVSDPPPQIPPAESTSVVASDATCSDELSGSKPALEIFMKTVY